MVAGGTGAILPVSQYSDKDLLDKPSRDIIRQMADSRLCKPSSTQKIASPGSPIAG
jgi:hypothetical protein